ncbi:hypothetical protein IGI04_014031 [Brassica rapa subsp. trilocularis]|uniref:Uncharacterized protein n=1 Tax=Brassica rapa subsp. trilocularis TaxID=1813537 RepID=A0ABQ7NAJ2_BRACM|nr:hypothetical protein IGI04_014031 [Brassica rapa subsp. trilocularis]
MDFMLEAVPRSLHEVFQSFLLKFIQILDIFFRYEVDFGRFLIRLLEDSQKLLEDSWLTS